MEKYLPIISFNVNTLLAFIVTVVLALLGITSWWMVLIVGLLVFNMRWESSEKQHAKERQEAIEHRYNEMSEEHKAHMSKVRKELDESDRRFR